MRALLGYWLGRYVARLWLPVRNADAVAELDAAIARDIEAQREHAARR